MSPKRPITFLIAGEQKRQKMNAQDDDRSIKAPSLLHSFAVIVLLLCSISVFNFTVRSLLGSGLTIERKPVNLIFDPDVERNWTDVCPYLTKETVHIRWKNTPCFNRTLSYRYIPWLRAWVWQNLNFIQEERKKKQLEAEKESEIPEPTAEPINEENCTKPELLEIVQKESPSNVVYTILTAMTLMLAIIAGLELFREKFSKKPVDDSKGDRRCSLAEFTIKRHLRKESQENFQRQAAFDEPKKVKEFLHQGSLDRAILNPSGKKAVAFFLSSFSLMSPSVPFPVSSTVHTCNSNEFF